MANSLESPIELTAVEIRSGGILQAALASLWRRKLLVLSIGAISIVLGLIAAFVIPTRYTAEAYIRGGFAAPNTVAQDDNSAKAGSISLDLARVVEAQSRWLQSQELARRVIEHLGVDLLKSESDKAGWRLFGGAVSTEQDLAVKGVMRRLSVKSDPRAYLITVEYTTRDPDIAVLITDAFVTEILRSTRLQSLFQQRALAQAALSNQLSKFGEKHPKVIDLRMQLAALNDAVRRQISEPPENILKTAGENVTQAIANPSKPGPLRVVGVFLLIGLLIGTAVALWIERNTWSAALSQPHAYLAQPGGFESGRKQPRISSRRSRSASKDRTVITLK